MYEGALHQWPPGWGKLEPGRSAEVTLPWLADGPPSRPAWTRLRRDALLRVQVGASDSGERWRLRPFERPQPACVLTLDRNCDSIPPSFDPPSVNVVVDTFRRLDEPIEFQCGEHVVRTCEQATST